MDQLKLIALDAQDLEVVSAHLQDAVVKVRDMVYLPREKRFAAAINRFDWSKALAGDGNGDGKRRRARAQLERRLCALRFDRVLRAQTSGLDLAARDTVLSLLAVRFEPQGPDDAAGTVMLVFSGDAAVRLEVECIEAELRDLGPVWRARARPAHPEDEPAGNAGETGKPDR